MIIGQVWYQEQGTTQWSSLLSLLQTTCENSVKHVHNQSLLRYKAMNVERQRCIFFELWSDSIHIALWRTDGFLHSFHDFSKTNAFSENLIRMTFWRIFWYNCYFQQHWALKWIYFPISVQYNIWNISIFQAHSATPEGDRYLHL